MPSLWKFTGRSHDGLVCLASFGDAWSKHESDLPMKCSVFHQWILFAIALVASSALAAFADGNPDVTFLKTYCVKCHGADEHKGDVRLDQLALRVTGENQALWKQVIHNLQRGDMPPEDARQPTDTQRQVFLAEVIPNLEKYTAESNATSDPLVRLTNNQIAHSLQPQAAHLPPQRPRPPTDRRPRKRD